MNDKNQVATMIMDYHRSNTLSVAFLQEEGFTPAEIADQDKGVVAAILMDRCECDSCRTRCVNSSVGNWQCADYVTMRCDECGNVWTVYLPDFSDSNFEPSRSELIGENALSKLQPHG